MNSTVYIETSVISYLTAKPSRDLIVAAHQQMTIDWWETALPNFEVFISPVVIEEAAKGDPHAAKLRLAKIASFQGIRTPVICTPEELMEG